MDPATLTRFLAPFLPFLLKLGNKAAETAAGKFGEDAWTRAKAVWAKLQPKVEAKAAAQEAVADVAESPEDEDYQTALRVQLKKLLENDAALAAAIAQIMQSGTSAAPQTQIRQNVKGKGNQVIGQVVGGTVFGNIQGNVSYGAASPSPAAVPAASSKPTSPKTILILAANPKGTSPLRLDQEVRDIQRGLDRAKDRFTLQQRWAVTPQDVRRALLDCKPQIVHFSGHGLGPAGQGAESQATRKLTPVTDSSAEVEGLMLEDATGQPQLVSSQALADLFALFAGQVECVLLNACYSETQATAIVQHIPYVIGMKRAIGDQAAIEFAIGFYDAVLAGESIEFAYKLGCAAIHMAGIPEHLTPVLKQK